MTIYSKINENNIIGNVTIEKINDTENIKISGTNHLTSYCRQLLKNKVKIWFGRNIPKVRFPQFPTLFSLALLNKPYVDGNEVKENDIISIKVAPQATNSSNASSSKVHWVFDFEEADGQGNIESVVWMHVFGNILYEHTLYDEYNYSIYIGGMFCDYFESIVEYDKPTYGITSYYNLPTPIVKTSNDKIRVTYDFLFT